MKRILTALMAFMLASPFAFASVGLNINGNDLGAATDINIKNTSSAGTTFFDGSQLTLPILDPNLFAAGTGAGGGVSQTSAVAALTSTATFISKVVPTNSDPLFVAGTLANGKPGQILTVYVVGTSPTGNSTGSYKITPTTKTGFQNVVLTRNKDLVTFLYVDDTTGWVIMNYAGSTSVNN